MHQTPKPNKKADQRQVQVDGALSTGSFESYNKNVTTLLIIVLSPSLKCVALLQEEEGLMLLDFPQGNSQ